MNTTTSFYPRQDMFTSSSSSTPQVVDQYNNNGYFTSLDHIENSLLNFPPASNDKKMMMMEEANFYPSPSTSPLLPNEMMLLTPTNDLQYQFYPSQQVQQQQFLDTTTMMMIPPLHHHQFEPFDMSVDAFTSMLTAGCMTDFSSFEHNNNKTTAPAPAIELVDQFIAQHQAALEEKEIKQQQPHKETSWSYYTYNANTNSSRDSTPEIVSDIIVVNNKDAETVPEQVVVTSNKKNKKTNKVTKGNTTPGRRGRGKGVKNSIANKKAIAAAAVAAAAAASQSSTTGVISTTTTSSSSKVPLEGALYVCQHPDCGRSFTRPYNLTSHLKSHSDERPFACSQCGRKFARQHDRNRHEKLHWGIRPYACHHCHKSFARMDALNRHLRMENGCTGIHL